MSDADKTRPIQAAGGVLWRERDGRTEFAVIHRPRYDDWSLPKGKAAGNELPIVTAVREVGEETGALVSVGRQLGRVRYRTAEGPKVVRYWTMQYRDGDFAVSDEADELLWLDAARARERLTYDSDRTSLEAALALPLPTTVIVLIRHAKAGKRAEWDGPDQSRPLDASGKRQARDLATLVGAFGPRRVLAADPLRCVETIQPLATRLGLTIEVDPAFADVVSAADQAASAKAALAELACAGDPVAVCSQGDTITRLVGADAAKGAAWVLAYRDGTLVSADYYGASSSRPRSR